MSKEYWTKKTVSVTKNGKTTTTVTETNEPPKDVDKRFKKLNEMMASLSKLMDEL